MRQAAAGYLIGGTNLQGGHRASFQALLPSKLVPAGSKVGSAGGGSDSVEGFLVLLMRRKEYAATEISDGHASPFIFPTGFRMCSWRGRGAGT